MSAVGIPLVAAKTTVTFTDLAIANETLILGGRTYVFKVAPSAAFEIDIKADETTQAAAIVSAINLDGTAGAYGVSHTVEDPSFSATSAAGVITLTVRVAGTIGNGISIEFTATNGTNITEGPIRASAGYSAGTGDFQAFIAACLTGQLDPKSKSANAFRELIA